MICYMIICLSGYILRVKILIDQKVKYYLTLPLNNAINLKMEVYFSKNRNIADFDSNNGAENFNDAILISYNC
ncbi:unnamed protein product [Brachionus calyciflorus]|uniref:Uncharacterized protein n=1 Tax=Brachionus calyciflorus TaxID=104777 RepID=A0A814GC95_9BILA|nr:unnamed protein product [Brachionus calyciflorus]